MNPGPEAETDIALDQAIELGIQAHRSGQLEAAQEIYTRILRAWPECPEALHFSGLLAFHHGHSERAVALIERSLDFAPTHAGFWNNFGNVLKTLGKIPDATVAYRNAIALHADFADAHYNLGVLAGIAEDFEGAVAEYRKAIAASPDRADAYLNLGTALYALERLDESAEAYQIAADLRPSEPEAYGRLGHIRWKQGRLPEAAAALRRNVETNATDPEGFVILARVLYSQGLIDECYEGYRQALKISPADHQANFLYGQTLAQHGRNAEAKEVWRSWSEADPENPLPRHYMAAGTDDAVPERSGDAFVVRVFDRFAEHFDQQLKRLEYCAPELVAGALRAAIPGAEGTLDVLDAGCGTGLCGPLVRPMARRLIGVDLSPAMLEKARVRGGYDELIAAELTSYISAQQDRFDAIISADTLCYFGKLEGVFAAAAAALQPGGKLVFTLEKTRTTEGGARLTLEHNGRYTHTEGYMRSAAAGAGLEVAALSFHTLRTEFFRPVEGLLVVAQRAAK